MYILDVGNIYIYIFLAKFKPYVTERVIAIHWEKRYTYWKLS